MKKFIFVISFVVFSSFLFGFTAQGAKAVTLSELQAQITRLHAQIAELQKLLYQIQPTGSPEEQIQKTETPGDFAPGRLLVRFKDNVPESKQVEILKAQGLTVKGEIKQLKVKVISVPEKAEQRLAQALSNNPNIDYAEPDYLAEIFLTPNDTYFPSQWGLPKVQAPEAWDITTGSSDVIIAILDTGVDSSHPDLADKIVKSINFTGSPTTDDVQGHGTHVAGIAAASTNNGIGVAGLGHDTSILNVKVLGDTGTGYYTWVASGIIWAADNGANVINMSLGSWDYSQVLEDAVNYAWDKGVLVVAAAGNSGVTTKFYPAYYTNCMAIAATDRYDNLTSWSNYGEWVDAAAPGELIFSTLRDGSYGRKSGTSMASPHVAGLAGLLASIVKDTNGNGFINDEIRFIIENNTDPFNWGTKPIANGRINAFSAVSAAVDHSPRTLTVTISGSGFGKINVNGDDYIESFKIDYDFGTPVTLTAIPNSGFAFLGWSGDCSSRGICNLIMGSHKEVKATFDIGKNLTISSTAGGSVFTPGEGTFGYLTDEKANLLVSSDLDYRFVNWIGDTATVANIEYGETTITMADDYSIKANFEITPECITYNGYTYCRGFRSTDPQGSSCNAACSARGYTCPIGDNMFRSSEDVKKVAVTFGLLEPGESLRGGITMSSSYYSPYVMKMTVTGDKGIRLDPSWNQNCTHVPLTDNNYQSIKICRCEGVSSTHALSVTKSGTGSGTVTSNPAGINCGTTCSASFNQGTSITLTATADTNSTFSGWSGACTGTGTCTLTMDSNKSVTATFNAITYNLSVNSSPVTGISIGSATGHSGTTNYTKTNITSGTSISLTAPATYGSYTFSSWTGCDSASSTTCSLTQGSNRTVTANYKIITHTLSVTKSGTGSGTVTSNPAGINCGTTCSASFNQGTSITLTATADTNSTFSGWSGACTGTGTCTLTMDSNKSVTATFDAINIIDCVKEYGQEYWCTDYQGWEMECRSKGDVKNLPQETFCKDGQGDIYDKCVTCWEPEEFSLSINSSPVTGIYVTANPYDYSNTTNYTKTSIPSGTLITLSAPSVHVVPGTNINYDFASWSGIGCSSSNNTISFSIISNMSCTASYKENILAYTLSVSKTGTGTGTVTSNPAGINCGTTCSASYDHNTSVTLTATADTNSTFSGWSGACTGTGTCTVNMDSNKSVTATFDKKSAIPEGCTIHNGYIYCRGFRSTDPQGSSCNAACSARGYTCPTGDNMFRSISQIAQVATTLGFLSPGERYSQGTHRNYYSPYIRTTLSTGAKTIYYDSNWNQICTHAPSTAPNQQRVKICRCQEALPSQTLEYAEYQLASLNNILSQLIDSLTSLIRR